MILTKKIVFKPNKEQVFVLNSLSYSSAKLWNIANYEKRNYKELGFTDFPSWYDQKGRFKDQFWYKNLPSQTAQNTLDILHKSWKSFFKLKKTGGIKNPRPPRFKEDFNFTFLNNGFKILDDNTIRFSLSKQMKEYLRLQGIDLKYLTLKINNFSKVNGTIKTIEFKKLINDKYQINIAYQIQEMTLLDDNGRYLSIDMGLSNLFTCYDNLGKSFIVKGNRYLEISKYFNKKIGHYQSIATPQQIAGGSEYGKSTKRINSLYKKKKLQLDHFFHSATKTVVDYCKSNDISKVIIGDIKGIRKNAKLGKATNQKLHDLPYERIYSLLTYKLKINGIELVKQQEAYSSQVSPFAPLVNKENASKNKRKSRGLYIDNRTLFNADSVGAFNILRLYIQNTNKDIPVPLKGLSNPVKLNVSM